MRKMPGIPNKYIIIPNRDLWSSVRNRRHTTSLSFRARAIVQQGIPLFCVFKMRFFTSLCSVQNDISVISNESERSLKNAHLARDSSSLTVVRMTAYGKDYNTSPEILRDLLPPRMILYYKDSNICIRLFGAYTSV